MQSITHLEEYCEMLSGVWARGVYLVGRRESPSTGADVTVNTALSFAMVV